MKINVKSKVLFIAVCLCTAFSIIMLWQLGTPKTTTEATTCIIAFMIFIIALYITLNKTIFHPLEHIVEIMRLIASGDTESRVNSQYQDHLDSLGRYINTAYDKTDSTIFWYQGMLDSIPWPISVTDNDMNWTFINKAAMDVTGAKREDIIGKQCSNWGADICGTDRCGIACLRRGQKTSIFSQPGLDMDFQVDAMYLTSKDGKQIGHIEVVQDITEKNRMRREAEKALKDGMHLAADKLTSIVDAVSSAAEELSNQVDDANDGAEKQRDRANETATAMEEMTVTVIEVAKNASDASSTANQARTKAEEGAKIVENVEGFIRQIHESAQQSVEDMGSLDKKASATENILNVISDIADQTNLLALNAAIEAARAGEAGRGFAVVADEVRKLAEKTMATTKEVGEAIQGIQSAAKNNYNNVEQSVVAIGEVTQLANKSSETLVQIVSLVEQTADKITVIATASEQQSATSEEINRSIETVHQIASTTSDAMNQSTHAINELVIQAQTLKEVIDTMQSDKTVTKSFPNDPSALALEGHDHSD
nr:methyl-accepting chemotaxis protein [Desulfovibrio inopinatus]